MTLPEPADTSASAVVHAFDTGSHENFYEYYKAQSLTPQTLQRFGAISEVVLRVLGPASEGAPLDVLDIGCGAGAQCQFWAAKGHRYFGMDINEPLVRLGRERAAEQGWAARFEVGSATALPLADASVDVCLLPELLEHISAWQACLDEAVRVTRTGGVIYISTSNRLCPRQNEYNLPAYSWYPGWVKRRIEHRAVTDWPAVANFAKYPAVNWFSFYQLRRYLTDRGFESFDRFDVMRLDNKPVLARKIVKLLLALPPLRLAGHMLTPETVVVARRGGVKKTLPCV